MDNYLKVLKERKELMTEILNLTKKQQEVINKQNYEELFSLIAEKKSIMKNIDDLEGQYQQDTLPSDEITKMLLEDIKDLVKKTIHIDDENTKDLKTNRDKAAEQVKQAHKNKQTHFEYQGKNQAIEGLLLDKKK